jgi:hypothetical protein
MSATDFRIKAEQLSDEISQFGIGFANFSENGGREKVESVGSGSLVSIGNVHGILTAAHVIDALPGKGLVGIVLDLTTRGYRRFTIEMSHIEKIKIPNQEFGPDGPDLGFLRLPPDKVSALKATNAFYNLSLRREEILNGKIPSKYYVDQITGVLAVLTMDVPSDNPRTHTTDFRVVFCDGRVKSREEVGGFDLLSFEVTSNSEIELPSDFGGVSGGALWRFYFEMKEEKPIPIKKYLYGVPFYQSQPDQKPKMITCHDPKSIYGCLIDTVTEKCRD